MKTPGRWTIAVAAMLIVSCASTPPRLIALPPAPPPAGTPGAASSVERPGPTVLVRRVTVPGYLDGVTVVVGQQGNTLQIAPDAEWAERLSQSAARVLRDALSQRLGPSRVLIEGDGRIPDADLTVEMLALDPLGSRGLRLDARWTLLGSAGERISRSGRSELTVPLESSSPSDVAAATARALGQFADALAREIEQLPRG